MSFKKRDSSFFRQESKELSEFAQRALDQNFSPQMYLELVGQNHTLPLPELDLVVQHQVQSIASI